MDIVEQAKIRLVIDGKEAVNELQVIDAKISSLREKQKEYAKGTVEYKQLNAEIRELEKSYKLVEQRIDITAMTTKQLAAYQRDLNKAIKDMDPASDSFKETAARIKEVSARQMELTGMVKVGSNEVGGLAKMWDRVKSSAIGFFTALSLDRLIDETVDFVMTGIRGAALLDDAFGKIQKTTEMTRDEVASMNEEIKKIDTRTAQAELLKIGEVGGQIGVAKDEMLGFVEATDMAVVALGDEFGGGAEEVTKKLAPLKTLFKETKELEFGMALNQIGSGLNELGAAGTATAPVVAEFTARVGQLGDLSPEISQVMGLGASFQEMGLTAEISAGGIANILLTAAKGTERFAQQLGITEAEFKKLIASSPNEMLLRLAESFKDMPIDQVIKEMDDMGIKSQEATKVMSLLKDQTDLVREKQELASKAMKEGTSLTREFAVMNNTAQAQLEKTQKALENKRVELGQRLLPLYIQATKAGTAFTGFLAENGAMLLKAGAWIAAYVGLQKLQAMWTERQVLLEGLKAAATRVSLVLQGQKILANQAETQSMNVLTAAETKAVAAANTFNTALQRNAIILAAMVALAGLKALYDDYAEAVEVANSMSLEHIKKTDESIVAERKHTAEMKMSIEHAQKLAYGTEARKVEIEKIMKVYPQYFKNMTAEQVTNWHLEQAYKGVNQELERKIELMAREKRVGVMSDRAASLKAELEGLGVYAKTLTEYNKTAKESFADGFKDIRGKLLEYESIMGKMGGAQKDLANSNINNFNAEARSAAARYNLGKITLQQYRDEVMAMQEKHKIFVVNYDKEKEIYKAAPVAAGKAASEKEKIKDAELDRDEARFAELFEMQKDQVERVQALEKEYLAWLEDFRKYRNKQINDAIDVIQKNLKKKELAENKAHDEVIEASKKKLGERIVKTNQDTIDAQNKANEAFIENYKDGLEYQSQALARWYSKLSNVQKQAVDTGLGLVADFLGKQVGIIEGKIEETSDLYEKARLETQKRWVNVGQDALNTLDQMLNGNIVGSVIGVFKTLAGALDNWLMSNAKEERARLEQEVKLLKEAGEAFMESTKTLFTAEDVENINAVYGTLIKMTEMPTVRYDMGDSEARLQQELAIGAEIVENYDTAVNKENELFETSKANEEKLYNDAIDKINKQYDAAVAGINKRYDWEQQMANRTFDLQSLGIQKQTNAELWALVTNNETKLSLTSEYEGKKASIMAAFASQIKPITADMSQAEIDGINRATEARDAQLSKLEGWLSGELSFVINNEGQKRKEYSATELIISNGQKALEDLAIKHSAAEIARTTARNIELAAAEAKKKTDSEAAEKTHLDNMEALSKAHFDKVTALGKAKDDALAESFRILNDIIKNGYDDMIAKAQAAYDAGKITADQYNEIANRLFAIKDMLGQIDWNKLNPPNLDLDFTMPKFAGGTEYVDPLNLFPTGTDTVPAYLDKGERVLDKNLNNLLGGISNEELVRRAIGGVRTSNAGLVNRINSSAVAGFGYAQPTSRTMQKSSTPTIAELQLGQPSVSNVYNNSNFSTVVMEQLLGDIHRAIVDKPVLDMGTLNNASNAVAVNIGRSRFA